MPGYISEIDVYGGPPNEFIELAIPTGTDASGYSIVLYRADGTIRQTLNLNTPQDVQFGQDIYILDDADGLLDINNGDAIAFVDDNGAVMQFLSFNNRPVTATTGPANGQSSTNMGNGSLNSSFQTDDGGATYYRQDNPNKGTIPCFAPGTLINTPDGPRAVEELKLGDPVNTLDNGPQPIRWIHRGYVPLDADDVDGKPVLISAGALGSGLPTHDLIVSAQHRIFVGGKGQLTPLFITESLAPAKSLTSLRGIRYMKGKKSITWIHFACDKHEIVTSNGCLSESLLLAPMAVNGMTSTERQSVIKIFGSAPTPGAALNGQPVRDCLPVGAVRRQLAQNSEAKKKHLNDQIRKWDVDAVMEQYEANRLRGATAMKRPCNKNVA